MPDTAATDAPPTPAEVLATEQVALGNLQPHPKNARRGDLDMIADSLQANGQYRAIVANRRTGQVLAGNHTLQAARRLGWPTILTSWIDVDEDTALRILLVDNRSNDVAGYDEALLSQLVHDAQGTDRGLDGTGFDAKALQELDKLVQQAQDAGADTDPKDQSGPSRVQLGDLWILGEHRLLCDDARNPVAYPRLMAGEEASMIWTDPPYGVDVAALGAIRGKQHADMSGDEVDPAATAALTAAVLAHCADHIHDGGSAYVCHPDSLGLEFRQAYSTAGFDVHQVLIWIKPHIVIGRQDYQWQHEPILYGWKRGASHRFYGDRADPTVIDHAALLEQLAGMEHEDLARVAHKLMVGQPGTIIRADRPGDMTDHPTPKPVEVIANHIRNSAPPKGTVLDPFGGSGSTVIAAENVGARARLIEIQPTYCDIIIDRWQRHTGREATLEPTTEETI